MWATLRVTSLFWTIVVIGRVNSEDPPPFESVNEDAYPANIPPVYSFYFDTVDYKAYGRNPNLYIGNTFKMPPDVEVVATCFYFYLRRTFSTAGSIFTFGEEIQGIINNGKFSIMTKSNIFQTMSDVGIHEWHYYCVEIEHGATEPRIFIDGEPKDVWNMNSEDKNTFKIPSGEEITISLGDRKNQLYTSVQKSCAFLATLPVIYDFKVNESQSVDDDRCQNSMALQEQSIVPLSKWIAFEKDVMYNITGKYYITKKITGLTTTTPSIFSNVSLSLTTMSPTVKLQGSQGWYTMKRSTENPCKPYPDHDYIVLDYYLSYYEQAKLMCSGLGGELPEYEELHTAELFQNKLTNTISGGFFVKKSNETEKCEATYFNFPYKNLTKLYQGVCSEIFIVQNLVCKIPRIVKAQLYPGIRTDHKDFFFPPNLTLYTTKRSIQFEAADGTFMTINDNGDQLFFTMGGDAAETTLSTVKTSDKVWFIGRHEWSSTRIGVEGFNMLLTRCGKDQFTCSDGHCIPIYFKTDGIKNCDDGSDEVSSIMLPRRAFNKNLPPQIVSSWKCQDADEANINNITSRCTTEMKENNLDVNIVKLYVTDLDVERGELTIHLKTVVSWDDPRVRFQQLRKAENYFQNKVDESEVYIPRLTLSKEAIFTDRLSFEKRENSIRQLYVKKTGEKGFITHDSYEGIESKTAMVLQEEFSFRIYCHFVLNLYPFGVHPCQFSLKVIRGGANTPVFNKSMANLDFKPHLISMFTVTNAKMIVKDDQNSLTVFLLLESQYGAYLLTTFTPCIIIGYIGVLTINFDKNNFTDRIMVTVSCLIVIATLFSQMTSNMPPSAQPKAVDYFFFFYICRMFVVCQNHTYIYFKKWRADEKLKKMKKDLDGNQLTQNKMADMEEKPIKKKSKRKNLSGIALFQIITSLGDLICLTIYAVYIFQGRYNVQKYFWINAFKTKNLEAELF